MASSLEHELSCPVCMEIFSDPVLLSCGHSFCRQCVHYRWTSSKRCPVCLQVSQQQPVSNLSLKSSCVSYLKEQNRRTEDNGKPKCHIHGKNMEFYCEWDFKAICSVCKSLEHDCQRTQSLQQVVRQRKVELKAAVCSAEKTLASLHNDTSPNGKISKCIQSQSQLTERSIKIEFEKLHQFLRSEEHRRIAALHEEENEKRAMIEKIIQREILSVSNMVREAEQRMEDDDVKFLQNYDSIIERAKNTLPDQELSSETLMSVSTHLGNLKYQVWEKMKKICPYYPVILNPNTSAPELSVSDDLTSVTSSEANNVALHRSRLVLGSVGYGNAVYTWDINVGNSRYWSLGVCLKPAGRSVVQPLTPERGFWGLRRDGDTYKLMTTGSSRLNVKVNPDIVRVKLVYDYGFHLDPLDLKCWRKVIFSDARSDLSIAEFNRVPLKEKIFPFLIAEDQSAPLCVVPSNVIVSVENKKLWPQEIHGVFFFIFVGLILFVMLLLWGLLLCQVQDYQSWRRG